LDSTIFLKRSCISIEIRSFIVPRLFHIAVTNSKLCLYSGRNKEARFEQLSQPFVITGEWVQQLHSTVTKTTVWDPQNHSLRSTKQLVWSCKVFLDIPIYISNKMQHYTVYYIWKLLYTFQVVPLPIIRSTYNCIYSICICHTLLLPATIVAGSSNYMANNPPRMQNQRLCVQF
jgi:hypothetical protein